MHIKCNINIKNLIGITRYIEKFIFDICYNRKTIKKQYTKYILIDSLRIDNKLRFY